MSDEIKALLQHVETCFGHEITTSRHFDALRFDIFKRTGTLLSPTTLKRLWGYLDEPVTPRVHTLDTLCRYAGWADWQTFLRAPQADAESGPVGRTCIDVKRQLHRGDTLALTWAPDRLCKILYLGNEEFQITDAQNTRLRADDRFRCSHIICDEPLYLNHLTRDSADLGTYVCGRKSGIRFRHSTDIDPIL